MMVLVIVPPVMIGEIVLLAAVVSLYDYMLQVVRRKQL